MFTGQTTQPDHFELILGHKDINLGSQKYYKTGNRIKTLNSGEELLKDTVHFTDNSALGLANKHKGNVLLFSKHFMEKKYISFIKDGYQLLSGRVEYLVYWYDAQEDKEHKIVLPKLRFIRT